MSPEVVEIMREVEAERHVMLIDVPEDEITEGMCRSMYYSHLDDDDWQDYLEQIVPGGAAVSAQYGITIIRKEDGTLKFPF